jgi:glycosyltransferase involved in cell wall biosynthesis
MDHQKISVIIPCYEQGIYLIECIESVLQQTQCPDEIIIVNDGSCDSITRQVINSDFIKTNAFIIQNQTAQGLPLARNVGIQHAQGTYILVLDADDKIAPRYIESATKILKEYSSVGIVCGDGMFFGARSGKTSFPEFSKWRMTMDNCIFSASIFRKTDWEQVGGYCDDFRSGFEDWDFYLSLLESGLEYQHLNEIVYYYRRHNANMTNSLDRNLKMKEKLYSLLLKRHERFFRQHAYDALLHSYVNHNEQRFFAQLPLITFCRKILRFLGKYP